MDVVMELVVEVVVGEILPRKEGRRQQRLQY
jgi:hypothetical protein